MPKFPAGPVLFGSTLRVRVAVSPAEPDGETLDLLSMLLPINTGCKRIPSCGQLRSAIGNGQVFYACQLRGRRNRVDRQRVCMGVRTGNRKLSSPGCGERSSSKPMRMPIRSLPRRFWLPARSLKSCSSRIGVGDQANRSWPVGAISYTVERTSILSASTHRPRRALPPSPSRPGSARKRLPAAPRRTERRARPGPRPGRPRRHRG